MAREVTLILDLDTGRLRRDSRRAKRDVDQIDDSLERTKKSTNALEGAWKKFGGVVGALAVGEVLRRGFTRAINKGREFEQQLADLEAITGITGGGLDQLGDDALNASTEFGTAATEIVEAQKLVASQLAERIDFGTQQGIDELKEISRQATILQRAAGVDLSTAVEATTQTINQFNLEAAESSRVINVLAAGAKQGAAEVADQAAAFRDAGTAASGAGVSIEQTQAAIQRLAAAGIRGQRAGTGLRNIFVRLQTRTEELAEAGFENIDIQANGFIETLRQLAPLTDDAVKRTEIFGEEAQQFAQILLQDVDGLEAFTDSVTDTDTAIEQADVQMNTFNGTLDRVGTALDKELIQAFQETGGVMTQGLEASIGLIGLLADGVEELNERARRTVTVFQNFSALTALDDLFRRNLMELGIDVESALMRFIDAQEQATDTFETQVDAVTKTSKAYADHRKEVADDEQAVADLNEQIDKNIQLLTTDEESLKRSREALLTAREGVDEGSKAYGQLSIRLIENERMLIAIGNAIERNNELRRQSPVTGGDGGDTTTTETIRREFEQGDEVDFSDQDVEGSELQTSQELTKSLEQQADARIRNIRAARGVAEAQRVEASTAEQVAAAGLEAAAASIARAESAGEAVRVILKAVLAEIVAVQIRKVVSEFPFPLNVALVGAAVAVTKGLFDALVPEFQQGGFTGRTDNRRGGRLTGGRRLISVNEDGRSEFIVNADSTNAGPRLVEAINDNPRFTRELESALFGGPETGESVPTGAGGPGDISGAIAEGLSRARLVASVQIEELKRGLDRFNDFENSIGN